MQAVIACGRHGRDLCGHRGRGVREAHMCAVQAPRVCKVYGTDRQRHDDVGMHVQVVGAGYLRVW